jgi:hypothetical protein
VKWRLTLAIGSLDESATLNQHSGNIGVCSRRSAVQWGIAASVSRLDIGTRFD